jgi:CheY-like chemotaxis protein
MKDVAPLTLVPVMISTPSLLITDDDRAFRETLRGVFEPRGFATLLAADGLEALQIARSQPVHLLLLDYHMPQLTGLETIRRLRASAVQTPCILMSAELDPSVVAAAEAEQVFSVLSKPFSISTITRIVRDALQRTYQWNGPK